MNLIDINSESQYNFEIHDASKAPLKSLIVVFFYAKWCELCKTMSPFVRKLSVAFSNVKFLNVDVEKFPVIAVSYNVIAMPTFVFIKDQNKVDELKGANASGLESKVKHNSALDSIKNGISMKRRIDSITSSQAFSKLEKNEFIYPIKNDGSIVKRKDRKHIPNDVRRKLIECLEKKICSRKEAAEIFGMPYTTVANIYKKYCTLNIMDAKVRTPSRSKVIGEKHIFEIKSWLKDNCSLTLRELQSKLSEKFHISISENTINKVIPDFHFSIKRFSDNSNLDLISQLDENDRKHFCSSVLNAIENRQEIVFIDESCYNISMRSFRNKKEKNSNLKTKNPTIFAAISPTGLVHWKSFEDSENRKYLKEFLDEIMLLVFDAGQENVVFIFNNLTNQNCAEIQNIIKSSGHELVTLPSISSDFNPVEKLFSQWESVIGDSSFENEEQLWNSIDNIRDIVTSSECCNYFLTCIDKCRIEISNFKE